MVCSPECRKARDRRLARARRALAVQDYRVDERERQRRRRERLAAAGAPPRSRASPAGSRHAQASTSMSSDLEGKVLEFWDRQMAVSRASLQRELPALLGDWQAQRETGG